MKPIARLFAWVLYLLALVGLVWAPPVSASQKEGTLNNDHYEMVHVDIDTDATTFNSSSATLALPRTPTYCSPACTGAWTRARAGAIQLRPSQVLCCATR